MEKQNKEYNEKIKEERFRNPEIPEEKLLHKVAMANRTQEQILLDE